MSTDDALKLADNLEHGYPSAERKQAASAIRELVAETERLRLALRELRSCLDPDDWMGGVTMHDFIDFTLKGTKP